MNCIALFDAVAGRRIDGATVRLHFSAFQRDGVAGAESLGRLKEDREKMLKLSAFTNNNLDKQGFGKLDDAAKSRYALPLRFTPGIGTTLIVIALVLQSPIWLGAMALVTLSGALFPNGMLIDLIYNFGVRHLFRAPALPPTPKPRQFSYLLSTILLTGSALSFYYGLVVLGSILGGVVAIGGAILTTTLWCLGSWYYRLMFKHAAAESC